MADTTALANWANFQNDMMTTNQITFGYSNPLYAELTGTIVGPDGVVQHDPNQQRFTQAMDGNREIFVGGSEIRVPLQLSEIPGAASVGEGGTWLEPAPFDSNKATANLQSLTQPMGITLELEEDAKNGRYSALDAVESLTASAYRALGKIEEAFLHGSGDALLQSSTSANSDSDGLTMTVGTSANWDLIPPGRVVDVLVKADGTDPGQGKRRKIASVDRSGGTVTFSTTQVASDGGSGNITLSTNDLGIYIEGSYAHPMAGLGQACATTGTFQGINKATVAQWQGIRIDGGAATLSDDFFDDAVYKLAANGVDAPDFAVAHPKTVDPYKATKTQYLMIQPQEATVPSGFRGIVVQSGNKDFPVIKALAAPRLTCRLVTKSAVRVYGTQAGPHFINDDGSMWRFPGRSTKKEATLFDRVQFVARDCGKLAEIYDLAEA